MARKMCWVGPMVLACSLLLATPSPRITRGDDRPLRLWQFREPHLSVPVDIRVYAADEASAKEVARAAYDRIDELNAIFSDYDAESEAMRVCRAVEPVVVSPELYFLLRESLHFSQKSDGVFDVTIGPLIKQWRRARRQKQLPTPENIAHAKSLIGSEWIKLDEAQRTVHVTKPGMQLDFGGIAKGYIAEEAFRVLEARGYARSLVAVAGDIYAGDPPPDAQGWKVGIASLDEPDQPPSRFLRLKRQSASTSGDAFQFVEIAGVRYSHIVDPKTGLGLTQHSSVTVVAPRGWQADGLATTVCLMGVEKGLKLVAEDPDVAAIVVYRNEQNELKIQETPNFSACEWRE